MTYVIELRGGSEIGRINDERAARLVAWGANAALRDPNTLVLVRDLNQPDGDDLVVAYGTISLLDAS